MQVTTKYGLIENRVIQPVEFQQTTHSHAEVIILTISMYID